MHRLLIVEDDTFVASLYQDKFRAVGFDVRVASSGAEAIASMKSEAPEVVLLDLVLGDATGIEVLTFARSLASTRYVPVVTFSNAYASDLEQAAWKVGATQCLDKASTPPERVIDEVRKALQTTPGAAAAASDLTWSGSENLPADLRKNLQEAISQCIGDLHRLLERWQAEPTGGMVEILLEMCRRVHSLTGSAALAGYGRVAQVSSALEALLRELQLVPERFNASVLRTIGHAIELLLVLFRHPSSLPEESFDSNLILVVDDEPVARATLCAALKKVRLRALALGDPLVAAGLFLENRFDLVFSDIEMPDLDGFALSARLRESEPNIFTPLIFVTSHADIQTRDRSATSGAVDFIAKPVLPAELAVKATVHLLRGRLLTAT